MLKYLAVLMLMSGPAFAQSSGCMPGTCDRSLPKFAQQMGHAPYGPADWAIVARAQCEREFQPGHVMHERCRSWDDPTILRWKACHIEASPACSQLGFGPGYTQGRQ